MNMRIVCLVIILATISILVAGEKSQLARLHYGGGGDWYNDSDILPNLVEFLNKKIHTDFSIEQAVVKADDKEIFNYPFVFMTGHGQVAFNEKEENNLRQYLLRGGFLYVDDDYGMDESFRTAIFKLFPEYQLMELPANHYIYHAYFDLTQGLPKIHEHDKKRPQGFAMFDDNGRMMIFYTYESNISDGWSNVHDDPEDIRDLAFQMGANLFYYLMGK